MLHTEHLVRERIATLHREADRQRRIRALERRRRTYRWPLRPGSSRVGDSI